MKKYVIVLNNGNEYIVEIPIIASNTESQNKALASKTAIDQKILSKDDFFDIQYITEYVNKINEYQNIDKNNKDRSNKKRMADQ